MSVGLILYQLINVYILILLVRVIMSWVAVGSGGGGGRSDNPIMQAVYQLTDPPINLIRQYMPRTGMMDFSVLVLFILLSLLQRVVVSLPF